jgi:Gamma-glutamyl cyclotransferase, AIG2-like
MPRRIAVFFYGLFMDADILRSKAIDPAGPRRASVSGFALRIGQRATLVPDPDGRAHGVLMELQHEEIDRLYADPSVQMYRPEAVVAEIGDGSRIAALCFNLPVAPGPDERNEGYAAKLRDLARRLHLPDDYIERIG